MPIYHSDGGQETYGSGEMPQDGDIVRIKDNCGYEKLLYSEEYCISLNDVSDEYLKCCGHEAYRSRFMLVRRNCGEKYSVLKDTMFVGRVRR